MNRYSSSKLRLYLWLGVSSVVMAAPAQARESAATSISVPELQRFVSNHSLSIIGQRIEFMASAGESYLYDDEGAPTASIFTYEYLRKERGPAQRPVVFITGGGPGSASHFLHVGMLGPWVLAPDRLLIANGRQPSVTPPYPIVDNNNSLLDVADLVFIDTVGTGYSRIVGKGKYQDFLGIDEDLDALAQFIQLWLNRHGRWNSPKFFLGESYGGTRAAKLPNILMGGPAYPGIARSITLNGVIVLVNGLGLPLGSEGLAPEWAAASSLVTQAVTARYHGKTAEPGSSIGEYFERALQFASTNFVDALRQEANKTLSTERRATVVKQIAALTGLPASAYASKLTISDAEYGRQLLADRGLGLGMYDSRYTLPLARSGGDPVADDAALSRSFPAMTAAFLDMQRHKLNVRVDRPFHPIRWRQYLNQFVFTRRNNWLGAMAEQGGYVPKIYRTDAEELAVAMNRNDKLQALVATGYYDFVLPPAMARIATEQAGLPRDRLTLLAVEGGHEAYAMGARTELLDAVRAFVIKASR